MQTANGCICIGQTAGRSHSHYVCITIRVDTYVAFGIWYATYIYIYIYIECQCPSPKPMSTLKAQSDCRLLAPTTRCASTPLALAPTRCCNSAI